MMRVPLLVFVACAATCHAQLLTNNGAAITVQNGAQVTVQGEVLNAAGGAMNNNGTIGLSGNWTNNSGNDCFGNSEGTVILNGVGQQIGGANYTMFNQLVLAGGDVALQQNAYVGGGAMTSESGVLDLGSANLILNSKQLGVTNAEPWAIARTTGFIVSETGPASGYGVVHWNIADHAPDLYTVPFGNAVTGDYLPLLVNLATAGSGSSAWLTFATYPTDPSALPNNRPLPTGMSSFTDLAGVENAHNVVDRFWIIDTEEYLTEPWVRFAFTYRESEWNSGTNTILEGTLQAQRWDGTWSNPPMGTVNAALNNVTTPPVNIIPQVWALVQGSTPLPIELLHFDAQPLGAEVLCTWATSTEINNDFFTVERSADGGTFTDIGEVDGAGNSQTTLAYAFSDDAPLSGLSYYRLRQTDLDGTETWSQAMAVWRGAPASGLVLFPNPCTDEIFIAGGAQAEERASILDATGRTVVDLAMLAGPRIDVSALPPGSYIVQLSTANGRRSARFVKR